MDGFIFNVSHSIHMQGEALQADHDFPFVANFGVEVIKRGEFLKLTVPPIDETAFFEDIFMCHLEDGIAVIVGVAAHDDLGAFIINGGVASAFQMLVGDAAVVPHNFVVPF